VTQLSDDCFAGDGRLTPLGEALPLLLGRLVTVTESEPVPLARALDRILAETVVAPIDVPQRDNSAVDGYAVYADDLDPAGETRLPVTGQAAAGHPLDRPARRGEAIRVFTGALLPGGADGGPDTVMMQEDCRRETARRSSFARASGAAPTAARPARTSAPAPPSWRPVPASGRRTSGSPPRSA
jgi:molybdopterin molybdotransferase